MSCSHCGGTVRWCTHRRHGPRAHLVHANTDKWWCPGYRTYAEMTDTASLPKRKD